MTFVSSRCVLRGYPDRIWPREMRKDGWPERIVATPRGSAWAYPRVLEDSSRATQITYSPIKISFLNNVLDLFDAAFGFPESWGFCEIG